MPGSKGTFSNLPVWWPVIISVLACGGLLLTTQSTLGYVARDVSELRDDVRELTKVVNEIKSEEFAKMRKAAHMLEMRVVRLERNGQ